MTGGALNLRFGVDAGTTATGDETYRIRQPTGATVDRDFRAADASRVTGGGWPARQRWTDGSLSLELFDLTNEFSGTLDRLFPVHLSLNDFSMLGIFGTTAGPLPAMLPERYMDANGEATFRGSTAGYFQDVDQRLFQTTGELILRANFPAQTVQGNIGNATFTAASPSPTPASPRPAPSRFSLDFTFNGQLSGAAMTFAATGNTISPVDRMTGPVIGSFYGAAGAAADEAGLTFSLSNSAQGTRYFGIGAGGHVLGPRPFLTPMTTVTAGRGPSVMVRAANVGIFGPRGAGSSVAASTLLNVSPNVSAGFQPGTSMDFRDDVFSLNYNVNGVTINESWSYFAQPSYTNFGTIYETMKGTPLYDYDHHNIGFDLGTSLAGALDNVFLIAVAGDTFSTSQNYGFVVFGTQTAPGDMPTTGTAAFRGNTRGVYLDGAGQFFRTDSQVTMNANFATGAVSGQATNFRSLGDYFPGSSPNLLDFGFSGSIASGSSTFGATASSAAGGLGLTGRVEGAFYGAAGVAPDEAGFAYQLGAPGGGSFMAGAAIMKRD